MNIAMVCDFFYPQAGGIELHIYQVAQQLIKRGHSVIIITHAYASRSGVRTLTNGLKVYYVPFLTVYREAGFPTVFSAFPILRNIFIRENIHIIHGHASMSTLCHEAIVHGHTMGLLTVFTDHSLFGFADVGAIIVNKVMKFSLTDVDHAICVSHTCRENTVLRANLDPHKVSVIPNAVIPSDFEPDPSKADEDYTTIIVCSRLYQNKGADLLMATIPRICAAENKVRFIIAGSGPKEVDLLQVIEKHSLQERVRLIGAIRHEQVRDVMVQGQIYLHASLTEAFGTVIVEAASCGLLVVTTNVGGIPEVLPEHMTRYAEPNADSIVESTLKALEMLEKKKVDPSTFHDQVRAIYSWEDVAERTERVYNYILENHTPETLFERLQKHYQCGIFSGKLYALCVVVDTIINILLDFFYPEDKIDRAVKWPKPHEFVDH